MQISFCLKKFRSTSYKDVDLFCFKKKNFRSTSYKDADLFCFKKNLDLYLMEKCRISIMWALAQRASNDDKAHPFRHFHKRMRLNSNPNRPYLFFRVFCPL